MVEVLAGEIDFANFLYHFRHFDIYHGYHGTDKILIVKSVVQDS